MTGQFSKQILAERRLLVESLQQLTEKQWLAGTLCAGWTVEDLAAHLVVRERGPILSRAGILLPFLHHQHALGIEKFRQRGHNYLIDKLSRPPTWVKYLSLNVVEFFVHNEDMLRGELHRSRIPSEELERALSSFVPQLARFAFRRVEGSFRLIMRDESSGAVYERYVGKRPGGEAELELSGQAGELVLLLVGRGLSAQVEVRGSDEAQRLYRLADVGV